MACRNAFNKNTWVKASRIRISDTLTEEAMQSGGLPVLCGEAQPFSSFINIWTTWNDGSAFDGAFALGLEAPDLIDEDFTWILPDGSTQGTKDLSIASNAGILDGTEKRIIITSDKFNQVEGLNTTNWQNKKLERSLDFSQMVFTATHGIMRLNANNLVSVIAPQGTVDDFSVFNNGTVESLDFSNVEAWDSGANLSLSSNVISSIDWGTADYDPVGVVNLNDNAMTTTEANKIIAEFNPLVTSGSARTFAIEGTNNFLDSDSGNNDGIAALVGLEDKNFTVTANWPNLAFFENAASNLQTYSYDGTDYSTLGNALAIPTAQVARMAELDTDSIVFIDAGNDDLRKYDFDGTDWSQDGNDLNIPTAGAVFAASLTSSRAVYINNIDEDLQAYDFSSPNWTTVGSPFTSLPNFGSYGMVGLTSSRLAVYVSTTLRTYDFNGSAWSQVGNSLAISGVGTPSLARLTDSRIAFIDSSNDELRTYDFDGTDWSQTGNGLSISGNANVAISAFGSVIIAFQDSGNDQLRAYQFDGTDWSLRGNTLALTSTAPTLAVLKEKV